MEEFRGDLIKIIRPLGFFLVFTKLLLFIPFGFGSHSFMVRGVCTVRICRMVSLPSNIGTLWYVPGKYHLLQQFSNVVVD
jgi:hypothetical protein